MNITFVTSLYNITDSPKINEKLLKDAQLLFNSGLKIVLYVDEFYHKLLSDLIPDVTMICLQTNATMISLQTNVTMICLPREQLIIFNQIVQHKNRLQLPGHRDVNKDTIEYLALMNSKIEFIERASKFIDTPYIAWIDAGIAKIFKDPVALFAKLKTYQVNDVKTILIPGSYHKYIDPAELLKHVWWIFSGGFFIGNKENLQKFYQLTLTQINKFLALNTILWEVNIWIPIYTEHRDLITWYFGTHNETIINIPKDNLVALYPEVILTAI